MAPKGQAAIPSKMAPKLWEPISRWHPRAGQPLDLRALRANLAVLSSSYRCLEQVEKTQPASNPETNCLGDLSGPVDHSQKGKSRRDCDPSHPHSEKSEASFVPLPPIFLLRRFFGVLECPPNQITKTWFVRRPEWWLISNLGTKVGHSQILLWENNEVSLCQNSQKAPRLWMSPS